MDRNKFFVFVFIVEIVMAIERKILLNENTQRAKCNFTKCFKNQPCDVIKMREMRRIMVKKPSKKEMDNHSFFDVTLLIFRHFVKSRTNPIQFIRLD